MGFTLGDIIVDRPQIAWAENSNEDILYTLTQLADSTLDTTAESKDATDANGTLIKRFYKGKTGTYSANNAMVNLNVWASMAGVLPKIAGAGDAAIVMPKMITVKASAKEVTLKGVVEGTVKVYGMSANGNRGEEYTLSEAASTTNYALAGEKLTLPTGTDEVQFCIRYKKNMEKGALIQNRADKFPGTIKLYIQVLAVDPCYPDTLRLGTIEIPSFQPSPETSISLTTDAQLEYKGDLQVDYCSVDKVLYNFYWNEEDVVEDDD